MPQCSVSGSLAVESSISAFQNKSTIMLEFFRKNNSKKDFVR